MKQLTLTIQMLLLLFFVSSCKDDSERETISQPKPQTLSDSAWLKLSSKSLSVWRGMMQDGIQDIDFSKEDSSLIILTNEALIKLNKSYEVVQTIPLLNDIYFSQIRFLPQHKITYAYSIYDGFKNGIDNYKPGVCTQSLAQTFIETQNGYTKDSASSLYYGLSSIDENFRVFAVTNLSNNTSFTRVQLIKDDKIVSSTDIPGPAEKQIRAFTIKENVGVIIANNFYQIKPDGQLSNPIVSTLIGKDIVPYKDGILVADGNRNTNYLFHTSHSSCSFLDYKVSSAKTSIDENYILIRRSKVTPSEPFVTDELVFINNQNEEENIISKSSINIRDIGAFWVTNNIAYIICNDGLFARLLK
jgi:hypothetical protein